MTRKKLLEKLYGFFDMDAQERQDDISELKTVLKKLKKKESKLSEELESITDQDKRKRLQKELDILHAQRKKGIKLLKSKKKA